MTEDSEILKDEGKAALYAIAPVYFWAYEAYDATQHSLKENATKLEEQHKLLFATLALTNNTYCNLYKKYYPAFIKLKKEGKDYTKSHQWQTIIKLGSKILQSAHDWFKTQTDLEKQANIPKVNFTAKDFLNPKKAVSILKQAQLFFPKHITGSEIANAIQGKTIGIVPVVIAVVWASAIITASISIAYIVHRMTISTQDRINLLNATKQTCDDLKLTPEECAGVLKTTQTEETKNADAVKEIGRAHV